MKNRLFVAALASLVALATATLDVRAQAYPSRTVTLVVPFPARSTTDNVARKLSEYMHIKTGATVIVDNKVGADGNVAAQFVLRAPADGYTVFVTGNSVHGANANLYKELPFDPINDFDMVGGIMTIPMVLAVRSDFPAGSVQEFVAESKKRQKPLFYATGNNSTRGASELFKVRYGLAVDHVPYRGSPQVLADLIGGQFDFAFIDVNTVSPALKDGRLKALAITSEKRLPALSNVPTVAESLPGFQFGAWVGVVLRGKTPPDTVARLGTIVQGFATDPETVSYLASIGSAPMPLNAKELKSFVEAETKTWAEIVKAANIEKK